ncbi:type II toxin-antitoxin system VapC family toxin [Tateyamaria omphalii]|uniref:Twitching motility protein PilT n=1 Tax=Tateyamaria omphalii TaxID=299262 RepID=A0A1P8N204_9RHOB|nr:type II toxin-antitoxin system VapC family toxin [Tateyamaria omphalii]APX14322.1 twitching motility protein PilT [Tateyamaria omphalii]
MTSVLLDTHSWVWTLTDDMRLTQSARAAISNAQQVHVSPITFFEIGQKVRVGKWPEMEPHVQKLAEYLYDQGGAVATMTPDICIRASVMEWSHRDPFDRLIGATAEAMAAPLISADTVFDDLSSVARVW